MGARYDIAIAGAGPAGLAMAVYLRRAGHRVTIFEAFEAAAPVGSGLMLQPTGLSVLDDLGLLDTILARGSRIDRLHGTDAASGRTVLDVRYDALGRGRFGLGVHRAALFDVLYQAALGAGAALETGREVAGMDAGAEKARLAFNSGKRSAGFDLVVDASGANSVLRHALGEIVAVRQLAYGAWWATLDWSGEGFDAAALLQRYRHASVMIGVLPIGRPAPGAGEQAAFFWSLKPAEAEATKAAGLDAWKARVTGLWPDCAAYLDQIDGFEQLTLARYGHHTLSRPAGRRLAVIGDAAHSTSPQLGQGANMALLDARSLAHALQTRGTLDEALEAYAAMRRWHVRLFQALSFALTPFYQSDSHLLALARDRLVAPLATVPPIQRFLASMVSGTLVDPFARIGLAETDWRGLSPD